MPDERIIVDRADATYVKVHPYFVNMERDLAALLRLLFTKSAPLGIIDPVTPLVSVRLRSCAIYILSSIGVKCLAARVRRRFGYNPGTVSLPDQGEIAMFCFPDCIRIFDLADSKITNVCSPGSAEIQQRLDTMLDNQKKLGEMGIAPMVYERNHAQSNYTEELCDGTRLKRRQWWRREVFSDVSKAARIIQESRPPLNAKIKDIIEEVSDCMDGVPKNYYQESCGKWLRSESEAVCDDVTPDEEIQLFLSHGDLACRNVLVRADNSLVFIDWYTLGYRIEDYDIYNYHFSIAQNGSGGGISESTVFDYLNEAMQLKDKHTALGKLARFKLQFLATRLKYFLPDAAAKTDSARVSNVLAQMRSYFACFARYSRYCDALL